MPSLEVVPAETPFEESEPRRVLVLVPDGTLLFMRPIIGPAEYTIGFESVWLEPGDDGIWRAIGEQSGHLYVHRGWYEGMVEEQQARIEQMREAVEAEQQEQQLDELRNYWVGIQEGNRLSNRLRAWFWVVLGRFARIGHRRGV